MRHSETMLEVNDKAMPADQVVLTDIVIFTVLVCLIGHVAFNLIYNW